MRRLWGIVVIAIGLGTVKSDLRADDWPQWAGPRRDGVWRETGLLQRFPDGGPKVLWRVPIGAGYSGPAVVGQRIFVMDRTTPPGTPPPPEGRIAKDAIPGQERVLCLDAATGKVVWMHEYDCPYQISYPSGPRTTPSVVEGKVYTLGAMGDLLCLDAATGAVIWARNYRADFGLKRAPVWGWSSSPLVHGGRVFSLVGGDGSAVVCFDAATGKELWRALTTDEIGYAPPVLAEVAGQPQLIVWHTEAVVGLDPASGKTLWSLGYPIEGELQRPEVSIAAPRCLDGNRVFLTNFYHGAALLRITPGESQPKVLWNLVSPNLQKPALGLHTVMCTPVIDGQHIYGICGHGELRCLELETGKRIWDTLAAVNEKRGLFAHAFLIPQGDHFWIYNDQGDLILARLSPKGYEEIGRAHLLDTTLVTRGRAVTWCHPAFANRCIYVRNDKEMVGVSLAGD